MAKQKFVRAKIEDVPAHDLDRFLKAQAKRERRAAREKEKARGTSE